ncbi:MAG: ABC transporter permease [Oscillospiraceae bacterium]|nr:ABC transporter permease [Oscillospiraceae bacterium]
MLAIFKRELKAYFVTPLGYVFIGLYFFFSATFFYFFTLTGVAPTVGVADISQVFSWLFFVLMITIPMLTMRLFSEERRNKTDQLTLTAPVSLFGIVGAKFAASYTIFLISTAIMPIYGIVLSRFVEVSWRSISGHMTGLLLLGAVYISVGIFISSLTENQMVAATISVFVNIGFLLSSIAASYIKIGFISDAFRSFSLIERYERFTIGLVEISNLLFFVSVCVVFLFLTVRVLEKRRWS